MIIVATCLELLKKDYNAKLTLTSNRHSSNEAIGNMLTVLLTRNDHLEDSNELARKLCKIITEG